MLAHGSPPVFRPRRRPSLPSTAIGSVPTLYRVTQPRTDGLYCRESAGTGPAVLKVVSMTDAAFSGITMDNFLCTFLFPRPLLICSGHVLKVRYREIVGGVMLLSSTFFVFLHIYYPLFQYVFNPKFSYKLQQVRSNNEAMSDGKRKNKQQKTKKRPGT